MQRLVNIVSRQAVSQTRKEATQGQHQKGATQGEVDND